MNKEEDLKKIKEYLRFKQIQKNDKTEEIIEKIHKEMINKIQDRKREE